MVTREVSYNLAGTVMNVGLPVSGTTIRLYDYWIQGSGLSKHFLSEQTTGPKGAFNFDVRKGLYSIEVVPNSNTRYARQSLEPIRVTSNTNINIVLKSGSILSGKVCDADDKPIANGEIMIFGVEPHVVRVNTEIDESGNYSISLPAGKYYLAVKHKQSESINNELKGRDKPFLCPHLQVLELYQDLRHNIIIPPLLSFQGAVTNSPGHPLHGVSIRISALEKPENVFANELDVSVETSTAKDGKFECFLQPGSYNVRLEAPADLNLAEKNIASMLVDQDRSRNYVLEPGYQLYGRVLFKGEPVPNALVTIIGINTDSVRVTDVDGYYSFSLSGGNYEYIVSAQPDSLGIAPLAELAPMVGELILDKDNNFDINLNEGVLVSGKVLDSHKQARAGLQLSLFVTKNGEFAGAGACRRPLVMGLTGDDGDYEFRLMPGDYWLLLNDQASTGHIVSVAGKEQDNDVIIDDVCVASFEVLSESDQAVPNCQITFEAYSLKNKKSPDKVNEIFFPMFTDEDGRCTLTLPAGIYSFQFHPPEDSLYNSRQIRQLSVVADMNRRVRLMLKQES